LEIAVAEGQAALNEILQVAQFQHPNDLGMFGDQVRACQTQVALLERELQLHAKECDNCKDNIQ
jgi:hypothetical protein